MRARVNPLRALDDCAMGVARVDRGAADDDDDDDDGCAARVVAAEEAHARAVAAAFVRQMRMAQAPPSGGRSDAFATSAATTTTTTSTSTSATPAARPEDVKATAEARRDAARLGDERDYDYERRRNADLTRKLERACVNNRKLEMEVHKLKSLLHAGAGGAGRDRRRARAATATATPAETFADGTPAMVSFEYHTSVMEAFDRKVESLVMEIERLRASGMRDDGERRALARELEPEPAPPARDIDDTRTPVRRAPRRNEEREDDDDDDDDDHAPFSPTMSPLDALLDKIASSSSLGRADRRGDDGRRRHRTILGDADRNRGDVDA